MVSFTKFPNESTDVQFRLNARISYENECGTVKYIGEIESQEGVWLGIEWDNPLRGRHSGTYKYVSYFETSVPKSGSFIRPWTVNTGMSCLKAIEQKYAAVEDVVVMSLPQNNKHTIKFVEMIGFDKLSGKQSQFYLLQEVILSAMDVNSAGEPGELSSLIPNVTYLDLTCNLLTSWSQIAEIVCQLPQLRILVLSKNRLVTENNVCSHLDAFSQLETLILNDMAYTWDDILDLGQMWPNIKSLSVCMNRISSLEVPLHPIFSRLQFLDLDGNTIVRWFEILKLGSISTLEELHLSGCHIEEIYFPDVSPTEKTCSFPNLSSLYLGGNGLSKWQDIAELDKLRQLKTLRISLNPVLQSLNMETGRQLVIAKICGLEILNKTKITKYERRGAEFDYVKMYCRDWFANGGTSNSLSSQPREEFLIEHPTYALLLEKYGIPEETEINMLQPMLKSNLLSIQIFSSSSPNKPVITKELPATMTICKVKSLIQKIFKVPRREISLTCLNQDGKGPDVDLDNDLRPLSFYSVANGDKIAVQW